MRTDQTVETRIELETGYVGPKYYMDLIEKVENSQLRERLLNCLLINKHFINVLERKTPDFSDYVNYTTAKSVDEKEEICKKFAKLY